MPDAPADAADHGQADEPEADVRGLGVGQGVGETFEGVGVQQAPGAFVELGILPQQGQGRIADAG